MKLIKLLIFILPFQCMAEPYYIELATNIRSDHIKEMKKQGFEVTMTGGGFFYDVEEIALGFQIAATPTIDNARILYVNGAERLLSRVNNNVEIQPYLHNRPFEIDNLDYTIGFNELPLNKSGFESVAYMFYSRGDIVYCTYDPDCGKATLLRTIHREPYDEAVRIVSEQAALSNNSVAPSVIKSSGWWNYFRSFFGKTS